MYMGVFSKKEVKCQSACRQWASSQQEHTVWLVMIIIVLLISSSSFDRDKAYTQLGLHMHHVRDVVVDDLPLSNIYRWICRNLFIETSSFIQFQFQVNRTCWNVEKKSEVKIKGALVYLQKKIKNSIEETAKISLFYFPSKLNPQPLKSIEFEIKIFSQLLFIFLILGCSWDASLCMSQLCKIFTNRRFLLTLAIFFRRLRVLQ